MERVLGIGGVFFRTRDPDALAKWYKEYLGVPIESEQTFASFVSNGDGERTV